MVCCEFAKKNIPTLHIRNIEGQRNSIRSYGISITSPHQRKINLQKVGDIIKNAKKLTHFLTSSYILAN